MHHHRTLDPHSPEHIWVYTRWALDHEAAIAWPGSTMTTERIEPAGDKDGLIRIVRCYDSAAGKTPMA